MLRNPNSTKVRAIQIIATAILMSSVFWDLGTSDIDIKGKTGFLFFVGVHMVMSSLQSVSVIFIMERPVFLREYANKTYGIWSYYMTKSVIEIPFQLILPVLVSIMIYFTVGMTATIGRFLIFNLVLILDVLTATSLGFLLG